MKHSTDFMQLKVLETTKGGNHCVEISFQAWSSYTTFPCTLCEDSHNQIHMGMAVFKNTNHSMTSRKVILM